MNIRTIAMTISLSVALLMLAGKLTAYYITGSSAILSDAAESIVHIAASVVAAFSLWYSMQAPDKRHPYGHGKIAYFSAGVEGALIAVAALSITWIAVRALLVGPELHELHIGLLITALLAAINCALGAFLVQVGKRHNSLVLVANGKHVLTDMWTSIGVVLGVSLVWLTGIAWLDPVIAILMAANICYGAYSLLQSAFNGLLDQADPENTRRLLACLQNLVQEGKLIGFHQLRHRQIENTLWIEVHVLMPAPMTIGEAHSAITQIEEEMRRQFPGREIHITTHIEPDDHDAHPDGHDGLEDPYPDENGPLQP